MELDSVQFELSNHASLQHPKLVLGDSVGLGDHGHKIHSLVDQLHVEEIDWLEFVQHKVKSAGWQGVGFRPSDQEPGQLGRWDGRREDRGHCAEMVIQVVVCR